MIDFNKLTNCDGLCSLFSLSRVQFEKVTGVAVASILLFGFQLSLSTAAVVKITCVCSVLTVLSEKSLRAEDEQKSWFDVYSINKDALKGQIVFMLIVQTIVGVALTLLNIAPPQTVAQLIAQRNMRLIAMAIVVAPIAEELFFRGFVMERIEDAVILFNRYVYPIYPKHGYLNEPEKHIRVAIRHSAICHLGQAMIFGAMHIRATQTKLANSVIFVATTLIGRILSSVKMKTGALMNPMIAHSIHNGSMVCRLLVFGR